MTRTRYRVILLLLAYLDFNEIVLNMILSVSNNPTIVLLILIGNPPAIGTL